MELLCKDNERLLADNYFLIKTSIVDVRVGSKYTSANYSVSIHPSIEKDIKFKNIKDIKI